MTQSAQALTAGSELCALAAATRRWNLDAAGVHNFIENLKTGLVEPSAECLRAAAEIPADATPNQIYEHLEHRAAELLGKGMLPDESEAE